MEIKLTTLCENTATGRFLAEWGLSVLVEVDGLKILMDTGASFSAVHNAQLMQIDLSNIDRIVISHGHYDHTGGLRDVLRRTNEVEVIAHPGIWEPKYSRRPGQREHHIGMPFAREELEGLGASFNLSREPVFITPEIMTTGEIPMTIDYEQVESNFFVRRNGELEPDTLADDLALVIKSEYGLVVVLGCSHRGIVNTLRRAREITGEELIHTVIGGTHLIRASEERIYQTIADLMEMGVLRLGVSHCTGFHASMRLAEAFGDRFFLNNVGSRVTIPEEAA